MRKSQGETKEEGWCIGRGRVTPVDGKSDLRIRDEDGKGLCDWEDAWGLGKVWFVLDQELRDVLCGGTLDEPGDFGGDRTAVRSSGSQVKKFKGPCDQNTLHGSTYLLPSKKEYMALH